MRRAIPAKALKARVIFKREAATLAARLIQKRNLAPSLAVITDAFLPRQKGLRRQYDIDGCGN